MRHDDRRSISDALRANPVEVLARTLYGEARGEPVRGKEAVAAVILNRVRKAEAHGGWWWGDDIVGVCLKPWQFSCWNPGDPNRARLLAVTAESGTSATCLRVARRAVAGRLDDPTGGATHYHARHVHPPWAWSHVPSAEIGGHLFYSTVA